MRTVHFVILKYTGSNNNYLTLDILMDFPIHIYTLRMVLPIVRCKGSQVDFETCPCRLFNFRKQRGP